MLRVARIDLCLHVPCGLLGVEGVEIDRRQQELRKAAAVDQVRHRLAGKGIEGVGAEGAEHGLEFFLCKAGDGEHAGLLHLGQIGGLVADFRGHGEGKDDLEHGIGYRARLAVEVEVDFGLPLLGEDLGRIGRFEGEGLDVDLLDRELLVAGVLVFFGHGSSILWVAATAAGRRVIECGPW